LPKPRHPLLCEINTRIWLTESSQALKRPRTLDKVTDKVLDRIAERGFHWVWMLGVWQTGTLGRQLSLQHPGLRQEFQKVLHDLTDADDCGSPFAVCAYSVHADFGGDAALRKFRERLRARGVRLKLDFVPNRTAFDHPWASDRPELYV
jgi:glycosidase